MSTPLVSVVIPTHNRPQYLPRAVRSALDCSSDSVEVIVVPNGSDESWKQSLVPWCDDARVRVSPITTAHGNVARNHGMTLARGKYLRFLDDDDYLYPDAAWAQVLELEHSNEAVSIGWVDRVDDDGKCLDTLQHVESTDFCTAIVSPKFVTQPTGIVYRRQLVMSLRWDTEANKRQDLYWNYTIAGQMDLKLLPFFHRVGAWVQHHHDRVSTHYHPDKVSRDTVNRVLLLASQLASRDQLTEERSCAISDQLWRCVHDAAVYDAAYWRKVAKTARGFSREGNPRTRIYRILAPSVINPWLVEVACMPWRVARRALGHEYKI